MLSGNHHISAFTHSAQKNYAFYHGVLGLRLVKKTVNQDKPSVYHLFYGNDTGEVGTIVTFFEEPTLKQTVKGTNAIERISLVGHDSDYWRAHFKDAQVTFKESALAGYPVFMLHDPDDLEVYLFIDEQQPALAHSLILGPTFLRVKNKQKSRTFFENQLGFDYQQIIDWQEKRYDVLQLSEQAAFSELLLLTEDQVSPIQRLGVGGIHHIAYGVEDQSALLAISDRLTKEAIRFVPIKDRYYFSSVYVREPNYSVIEIATLQPGFTVDEPVEELGNTLKLPPFLEKQRLTIEALLPKLSFK